LLWLLYICSSSTIEIYTFSKRYEKPTVFHTFPFLHPRQASGNSIGLMIGTKVGVACSMPSDF
ncbi:hypothetical protein, partial [Seonamhaeicola sediminis]|uniref:hypothetical protein n=1 Tax=Seonamhaeicola sediminis TaxID=2528206 RepID=UPI001C96C5EB